MKSWKEDNKKFPGDIMHNWVTMPREQYEREYKGYRDPTGIKKNLKSEYEFILNLLETCSLNFYEKDNSENLILIVEKENNIDWLKFYFDRKEEVLKKVEELDEKGKIEVEILTIVDFDVIERKYGPVLRILDSSDENAEIVAQFPLYKNYIDMGIVRR